MKWRAWPATGGNATRNALHNDDTLSRYLPPLALYIPIVNLFFNFAIQPAYHRISRISLQDAHRDPTPPFVQALLLNLAGHLPRTTPFSNIVALPCP